MLIYQATYKFVDGRVRAEVPDFPGVVINGPNLEEARRLLGDALTDAAMAMLQDHNPLPRPSRRKTAEVDIEDSIHLLLNATPWFAMPPRTPPTKVTAFDPRS